MNGLRRMREFEVEALGVFRVADKLSRAGVELLSFRLPSKTTAVFTVNGKDVKKVFAILRGSCYNIKKVRPCGLSGMIASLLRSAGMLAGVLLFFVCVLFFQTRVLCIRVEGSGAYYRDEVFRILEGHGVRKFSALPKESKALTAEIFSLPRVSFCTVKGEGGILTVTVEVTGEEQTLNRMPLLSPAAGRVEELVVIRGTPLVEIGQEVAYGDVIVGNTALFGEEKRELLVIARVVIGTPFRREYGGSEESARLNALLEFGNVKELTITKTQGGWLAEGVALSEGSMNLT